MPRRDQFPQPAGGVCHDLGALLARQAEQGVLANPQRVLRLVGLGQAPCRPEHDKGTVEELGA